MMPLLPENFDMNEKVSNKQIVAKKRGWKKPKGKPKRPLSAYNIFFRCERERIILSTPKPLVSVSSNRKTKQRRDRIIHGKISFEDLAKEIGSKWKNLDDSTRKGFECLAAVEKKRYEKALRAWNHDRVEEEKSKVGQINIDTQTSTGASNVPQAPTGKLETQGNRINNDLSVNISTLAFNQVDKKDSFIPRAPIEKTHTISNKLTLPSWLDDSVATQLFLQLGSGSSEPKRNDYFSKPEYSNCAEQHQEPRAATSQTIRHLSLDGIIPAAVDEYLDDSEFNPDFFNFLTELESECCLD